jgi:hypothetical protein
MPAPASPLWTVNPLVSAWSPRRHETHFKALKDYIDQNYGEAGITIIEKAELPIANTSMGAGAMPVGGGNDFKMLDRAPNYSLPVQGLGLFRSSRL